MRNIGLSLVVLGAVARPAAAAPTADLVVVFAPGMRTTPLEAAAKRAGAAMIDTSPKPAGAA